MMTLIRQFLITAPLFLIAHGVSFAGPLSFYWERLQEKQQHFVLEKTIRQATFKQLKDHNNPSAGTFSQRYYIDETYGKRKESTVFFYICGEGACNKRVLSGAIRAYAQKHHAKLIALEHRYYGQSLPVNSFSTENLGLLSTETALDDLAYFQRRMSDRNDWTGTWIAFGGSYAGSLSAYYRLKFPYLVAGALASSAPVMAKEDFIEYDRHVTEVAGPKCANQMRQVVSEVEATLTNPSQLEAMKELFVATEVHDPIDFLYLIADTGATAVQYGMKDKFCSYLDQAETPLKGYADFAKYLYTLLDISAVQITPQAAMSEDPAEYSNGVGIRQWYYQSCKEYGYWQNANPDPSLSSRSALINLDYHHQICKRLFGLETFADTKAFNDNYYYPLLDELVSNIYFTNGENDPWSNLSIAEKNGNAINAKNAYYLISGAAHCDDLHSATSTDSSSLVEARKAMNILLAIWLK